jgi:hypothetical protein
VRTHSVAVAALVSALAGPVLVFSGESPPSTVTAGMRIRITAPSRIEIPGVLTLDANGMTTTSRARLQEAGPQFGDRFLRFAVEDQVVGWARPSSASGARWLAPSRV